MHDLHNNVVTRRVISPVAVGTTGTGKTGKVIDRQGFDGVEFVIDYGTVTATNGTIIPTVLEGDVTSALTSVADADLIPTVAGEASAALPVQATARTSGVGKNITTKLGYKGKKRYVTVKLVPTVTAGPPISVTALLFNPAILPVTVAQAVAQ
jgi:hypothetical protein